MSTVFLCVALFFSMATVTACVRGRALGWLIPLWFLVSTATTELAPWVLITQLALLIFGLVVLDPADASVRLSLFLLAVNAIGLLTVLKRHFDAGHAFERALSGALGDDWQSKIQLHRRHKLSWQIRASEWSHPISFARPSVQIVRDISYGPHGKRNLLDVYAPVTQGTARPVLLQIHGGAWFLGHKAEQALPLLHHMAALGWVCVSINYRLSPAATFPDHIIDVKQAIAWIREHITEYGGDPDFVAVTGGSAGGHLAALAALSPNDPQWQPDIPDADTSLQAAMPLYGVYDLCDREGIRRRTSIDTPILERFMKTTKEQNPALYDAASPITRCHAEAPPFFVVQGTNDTLVWMEEARRFVAELSAVADAPVAYAELPGAQHSFEVVHSPRTSHWLNAAAWWLEWSYADWQERQRNAVESEIAP